MSSDKAWQSGFVRETVKVNGEDDAMQVGTVLRKKIEQDLGMPWREIVHDL